MKNQELLPHLFRSEYRKIVSVLSKRFGFDFLETAEDIASETFLTAAQTWPMQGLPLNPAGWLYTVAKNKAYNHLHRSKLFENRVAPAIGKEAFLFPADDIDLSQSNIKDSQLQMMFAVCHPAIPPEAQIALALRVLCGFGIEEITDAFLSNKETINKRLFRAKEKLRANNIKIEFPSADELPQRLSSVLTTVYLLFNEGYYSESQDQILRKELCLEAMRLCQMLLDNQSTDIPETNALMALMCFHASRFDARLNQDGEIVLYNDQDTSLWNWELISKGCALLNKAAVGEALSKYHLEASIAYWNTVKDDNPEKWENILQLYNKLLQLAYSPAAALNRTYALAKARTKAEAIIEAEKLKLTGNRFYYALLGELYTGIDDDKAAAYWRSAYSLAKSVQDRTVIQKRISALSNGSV